MRPFHLIDPTRLFVELGYTLIVVLLCFMIRSNLGNSRDEISYRVAAQRLCNKNCILKFNFKFVIARCCF
jgi:hypothetical protein